MPLDNPPADDWTPYYQASGERNGVDPSLLKAFVQQESGGRRYAVNTETGAAGPMGLMQGTAAELGVKDRFDPEQAIEGGAKYIRQNADRFNQDPHMAIAAYYGGPNTAQWGPKTLAYAQQVADKWDANKAAAPQQQAQAEAPKPSLKDQIGTARQAGYSDQEIYDYLRQTKTLGPQFDAAAKAGYSQTEIMQHLGLAAPKPTMAKTGTVVGEIKGGDPRIRSEENEAPAPAASNVGAPEIAAEQGMPPQSQSVQSAPMAEPARRLGAALAEGWNSTPGLLTDEAQAWLDRTGLGGVTRLADMAIAAPNAVFRAGQEGIQMLGESIGQPQLGRDIAAMPEAFMGTPHAFPTRTALHDVAEGKALPPATTATGIPAQTAIGELERQMPPPAAPAGSPAAIAGDIAQAKQTAAAARASKTAEEVPTPLPEQAAQQEAAGAALPIVPPPGYRAITDAAGNWVGYEREETPQAGEQQPALRLYRGEGKGGAALPGQPAQEGSRVTGGWFTTNPDKAARYGTVRYVDVTRDDLWHFAQGHGGPDEYVTDNPKFRDRSRPLEEAPRTPPESIPQAAELRPTTTGSFTTAKGSEYQVHEDGTTTRNKAYRPEHGEAEQGPQLRSESTVYLDPANMNRLAPPSGSWRVVPEKDGTYSLITKNADGSWGIAPSARNVPVETAPRVGLVPMELWDAETIQGRQAYQRMHPGNVITEVQPSPHAPEPQVAHGTDAAGNVVNEAVVPPAPVATEKAPANVENAGQLGPGKSEALAPGREGAGTEAPAGEPAPTPRRGRKPTPYATVPPEPQRLINFLRRPTVLSPGTIHETRIPGGLRDPGGDIASIIGGAKGRPGLINDSAGRSPNDAMIHAWENGYLPDHPPGGEPPIDEHVLHELIWRDHNGQPVYSSHDADAVRTYQDAMARNSEIDQLASQHGIPTTGLTHAEFFDRLAEHLSTEEQAQEMQAQADAHDAAYAEFEKQARQLIAAEAEREPWHAAEFYGQSQVRTLRDLEDEHQQEEAATAAQQHASGHEEPKPAAAVAGPGKEGGGPRPGGAGNAGRVDTQAPSRDLLGRPVTEARERAQSATIHNDPNQVTMPGMEPSAVQAQAARDAQGRGALQSDVTQKPANEGLFAPDTSGQSEMLEEKPARIRTLEQIQAEDGVGAKKAAEIQQQEILARGRPVTMDELAARKAGATPPATGGTTLYSFPGMLFDWDAWRQALGRRGAGAVQHDMDLGTPVSSPANFRDRVARLPKIGDALAQGMDNIGAFGRWMQMAVAPMAAKTATIESRALAKDWANLDRLARMEGNATINWGRKNFTTEQRRRMWDAADADSVAIQTSGEPLREGGVASLSPAERDAVQAWQREADETLAAARRYGITEAEGLPSYVPRMVVDMVNGLTKRFGEGGPDASAEVARDILTLPLATMRLRQAVAGRALINQIKTVGLRTGQALVSEGGIPGDIRPYASNLRVTTPQMKHREYLTTEETEAAARRIPRRDPDGFSWFTIRSNPAFHTWRPRFVDDGAGGIKAMTDENGRTVMERVPIYVRGDFEGALNAIMHSPAGGPLGRVGERVYNGLMDLKGRMMTSIMYGVAHLGVVVGRSLPAAPNIISVWRNGAIAKADPATMRSLVLNGLAPIGSKMGFRDVAGMIEDPQLTPGRSWTSKLLAAVPGIFDPRAGEAVKRGVDALGDFAHNTLLWDQVQSIQVGLALNFRDHLIDRGLDPVSATRAATHFANVYAGALPREAMSQGARAVANMALFSRSYRIGNLAAIKDMFVGLPKDVQAQIARDAGPEMMGNAVSLAKRKAISTLGADLALYYVGNSLMQSIINAGMSLGPEQQDLPANTPFWQRMASEFQDGYLRRLGEELHRVVSDPTLALNPFGVVEALTPLYDHEPQKQNRLLIGYDKDGTGIYARNPTGKFAEDIGDYFTRFLDTAKRIMSPYLRPVWQAATNDTGFGQHMYDPLAHTPRQLAVGVWNFIKAVAAEPAPWAEKIWAAHNRQEGAGSIAAQLAAGAVGTSISKGYPGGPAMAEVSAAKETHDFDVQQAMPGIRNRIRAGDIDGARAEMESLKVEPWLQRYMLRHTPQADAEGVGPAVPSKQKMRGLGYYGTPEQIERVQRGLDRRP